MTLCWPILTRCETRLYIPSSANHSDLACHPVQRQEDGQTSPSLSPHPHGARRPGSSASLYPMTRCGTRLYHLIVFTVILPVKLSSAFLANSASAWRASRVGPKPTRHRSILGPAPLPLLTMALGGVDPQEDAPEAYSTAATTPSQPTAAVARHVPNMISTTGYECGFHHRSKDLWSTTIGQKTSGPTPLVYLWLWYHHYWSKDLWRWGVKRPLVPHHWPKGPWCPFPRSKDRHFIPPLPP